MIGEPHPRTGETVVAFVVPSGPDKPDPVELLRHAGPAARALQAADARRGRRPSCRARSPASCCDARCRATSERTARGRARGRHRRNRTRRRRHDEARRRSPRSRSRARSRTLRRDRRCPGEATAREHERAQRDQHVAAARAGRCPARARRPNRTADQHAPPITTTAPTPLPMPASARGSASRWSLPDRERRRR